MAQSDKITLFAFNMYCKIYEIYDWRSRGNIKCGEKDLFMFNRW